MKFTFDMDQFFFIKKLIESPASHFFNAFLQYENKISPLIIWKLMAQCWKYVTCCGNVVINNGENRILSEVFRRFLIFWKIK